MAYDIVLIMVPPWEPKKPPLGLAYISEYLKFRGFKPKVIDFNIELFRKIPFEKRIFWEIHNINTMHPNEITKKMFSTFREEIEDLINQLISLDCDLIGFSVNIASIGLAGKIATLIKKKDRNKKIIFGGTGCFWEYDRNLIFPEDIGSIDAFVIGEGEETLERIINNSKYSKGFEGIKGVICHKEDFLKPAEPSFIYDVDKLPFPTFSDFNLGLYTMRQIPMLISRGCIGRCSFCIDYPMCGTYRYRSPEKVLEEIEYHIRINKIRDFGFNDLICNGNLKQLEKICDLIIEAQLNIVWGSYAMIRKEMSFELLKKMHRAGCIFLCYGLESGCNRTLKRMNKFYTAEDAERIIRATHEAGIKTAINIIVGFPGETKEDFEETLSFIRKNKEYIDEITNISSFVLMPGSKMGENPSEYGIKLPFFNNDLNLFVDENRLDLKGRLSRVRKTIFTISNLGIHNVIVNQPGLPDYSESRTVALINCPPARVDLLPLGLVRLSTYLKNNNFIPMVYDLNILLYNSVSPKLKEFWNCENWYLWSLEKDISPIFNSLEGELFELTERIISSETNRFCFLITKENFIFSLEIAFLLKKYNPNIQIIFIGSILEYKNINELIPEGIINIFISPQEDIILSEILNNKRDYELLAGVVLSKSGRYFKSEKRLINIGYDREIEFFDFSGLDLKKYAFLKIPLDFGLRDKNEAE